MSDTRLRSLERAAASGDVEAQARQLAERVRAGTLTRERLELAAYCGHEPALVVTPRPKGAPSDCGLCHGHPDGILSHATDGPAWCRIPCEHELAAWVRGLELWPGALACAAWTAHRALCEDLANGGHGSCALDAELVARWSARQQREEIREAARQIEADEDAFRAALEHDVAAWALSQPVAPVAPCTRCKGRGVVWYGDRNTGFEEECPLCRHHLGGRCTPHIDPDPELPPTPTCASCLEPCTDGGVKEGDELLCLRCGGEA